MSRGPVEEFVGRRCGPRLLHHHNPVIICEVAVYAFPLCYDGVYCVDCGCFYCRSRVGLYPLSGEVSWWWCIGCWWWGLGCEFLLPPCVVLAALMVC